MYSYVNIRAHRYVLNASMLIAQYHHLKAKIRELEQEKVLCARISSMCALMLARALC